MLKKKTESDQLALQMSTMPFGQSLHTELAKFTETFSSGPLFLLRARLVVCTPLRSGSKTTLLRAGSVAMEKIKKANLHGAGTEEAGQLRLTTNIQKKTRCREMKRPCNRIPSCQHGEKKRALGTSDVYVCKVDEGAATPTIEDYKEDTMKLKPYIELAGPGSTKPEGPRLPRLK